MKHILLNLFSNKQSVEPINKRYCESLNSWVKALLLIYMLNVGGIQGLCVIQPSVFGDDRGYFMETYNQRDMQEAGLDMVFVQDNQSCSVKGVLRGLHFQKQFPQGKLVRVVKGSVFDVAVDLRSNSRTYG